MRCVVLTSGVVLHSLFMFITATVLPSIVTEIGGVTFYAWVTTFFGISSIAGAMMTPAVLRSTSPDRGYQTGLLFFLLGSVICACASDIAMVILGRSLQGLGGGLMAALATTLVPVLFSETLRPRALALISSMWGPVALIGPLIGGYFAHVGFWRGTFWVVVPVTCVLWAIGHQVLPRRRLDSDNREVMLLGAETLRLSFILGGALILSLASVASDPSHLIVGTGLASAFVFSAIRLDRRASHRLFPSGAFDLKDQVGVISASMVLLVLAVGAGPFIPYILIVAHGVSVILAGYVAALSSLSWSIAALVSATFGKKMARRMVAASPLCVLIAMLGIAWGLWLGNVSVTAIAWSLFGTGVGIAWPHLASQLIGVSKSEERSMAGGFVTTLQILAGTFGAAFAGLVANLAGLGDGAEHVEIAKGGVVLFLSFAALSALTVPGFLRLLKLTAPSPV
jgi:MFS family permease